ncbi:MAG: phosphoenolpyruvate synthase, partial [Candidatus Sungiibacteriota bacterium]
RASGTRALQKSGIAIRRLIMRSALPPALVQEIRAAYRALGTAKNRQPFVAVRSSATSEDLPDASFAGQMQSFLYIAGEDALINAIKNCMASLFTDRAISYRKDKGFASDGMAISVGVQRMVRSDTDVAGTLFTLDPETGFKNVVVIQASYGLGELLVQGRVIPDEYIVFKPLLGARNILPIIGRTIGEKSKKAVYANGAVREAVIAPKDRIRPCLADAEIIQLAEWGVQIENYFSKQYGRHQPMDIEWARDGITGEMFIVQARPETIYASKNDAVHREYQLKKKGEVAVSGIAVGMRIGAGRAQVIKDAAAMTQFRKGSVLVARMTDPNWEPIMKSSAGIITDQGGRTSHAAIISRELGIPCIVGAKIATHVIRTGEDITIDCSNGTAGVAYRGILPYITRDVRIDAKKSIPTKLMLNIGSSDEAFRHHYLPAEGVGLGRLEFIISSGIGIHPRALIDFQQLKRDKKHTALVKKIDAMTRGAKDKTKYYVDTLALGIAKIAAVFWPHPAIIRFSDFKTNEYRLLTGGELYEPQEENPMLGWRGASRYYDPAFAAAFMLECRAIKKVRDEMGFGNVVPMIPFCRTPEEGKKVIAAMAKNGLDRKKDKKLQIYMMCEIPSNVLQIDEFLDIFDGMSIGSNDLAQLTLGMDRDSSAISHIANENNDSVKALIRTAIRACRRRGKYIGICGQAPSDYPDFAEFLV